MSDIPQADIKLLGAGVLNGKSVKITRLTKNGVEGTIASFTVIEGVPFVNLTNGKVVNVSGAVIEGLS